jgi:hypothetical protein
VNPQATDVGGIVEKDLAGLDEYVGWRIGHRFEDQPVEAGLAQPRARPAALITVGHGPASDDLGTHAQRPLMLASLPVGGAFKKQSRFSAESARPRGRS